MIFNPFSVFLFNLGSAVDTALLKKPYRHELMFQVNVIREEHLHLAAYTHTHDLA
jgi:hypothetical protein